tara:strand:+ start:851 stop:1579 length:729 start_codon:yes stop_codon:yes gene_type:complete
MKMRKIDLEAERIFENRKALGDDVRASQNKFYWATDLDTEAHKEETFKVIKNKNILEIGCASGYDAANYTEYANSYLGLDISDEAINNCKALELKNAEFICVDGHILPVGDQTLDYVIVTSLLHHLDIKKTFSEIARVLKHDGSLIFLEPLGTNPLFQIYRFLTPKARTVDERPFTFGDLSLMQSYFVFKEVRWFGFLNILSAYIRIEGIRKLLTSIDRVLSKTFLKYFFWQFSGVAKKLKK